jgi:hypothetical protein
VADTDDSGLFRYRSVETLDDAFDIMVFRRYHDAVYADTSPLLKVFPNGAASFVFNIRRQNAIAARQFDAKAGRCHRVGSTAR